MRGDRVAARRARHAGGTTDDRHRSGPHTGATAAGRTRGDAGQPARRGLGWRLRDHARAQQRAQDLAFEVAVIFREVVRAAGVGKAVGQINVSDREEGWSHNYPRPDAAVILSGGQARNCGTHWCGGPDFVVEILSPYDRAREKIPFYAKIGSREVLMIDREPWALELYGLRDGQDGPRRPIRPGEPGLLGQRGAAARLPAGRGRGTADDRGDPPRRPAALAGLTGSAAPQARAPLAAGTPSAGSGSSGMSSSLIRR